MTDQSATASPARTNLLAEKAVVITGAGRGIGRALALAAARHGAAVVVNNRTAGLADAVAEEIRQEGGTAVANGGSVTSWTECAAVIEQCLDEFGRIDGLVNNAALFHSGAPDEISEAELRQLVETNLLGTMFCGIHAIRAMRRAGRGTIINVTAGSQMGNELVSAYGASKGAVASLTYCWAIDLRDTGIRVNAVWPTGGTRLAMMRPPRLRPRRQPSPESNAPLVLYLLSDRSAGITGQVFVSRGRLLAVASHPAVADARAEADDWSVDSVTAAFDSRLRGQLAPLGPSV
jgi:NAD(P)-dependent dehydrogenase (short-subunit alcohol dehydrogenase family)